MDAGGKVYTLDALGCVRRPAVAAEGVGRAVDFLDHPAVRLGGGDTASQDGGNIYRLAGITCDVLAESFHATGTARSFTESPDAEG